MRCDEMRGEERRCDERKTKQIRLPQEDRSYNIRKETRLLTKTTTARPCADKRRS